MYDEELSPMRKNEAREDQSPHKTGYWYLCTISAPHTYFCVFTPIETVESSESENLDPIFRIQIDVCA